MDMTPDEIYEKAAREIMAAKSTQDVIEKIDCLSYNDNLDYEAELKWAYLRALELADVIDEALEVFYENTNKSEAVKKLAFDKALQLCKSKTNVQYVLIALCVSDDVSLEYEGYFAQIFRRAKEL